MKRTIDLARLFTFLVAYVLAATGLISWWIVLLFFLYSLEYEIKITTGEAE